MVGYADTSKAYRLYEKATAKITISRGVYFIEVVDKMGNKPTAQAKLNKEIIKMQMEPLGENIAQEVPDQSDSEFESAEEENRDLDAVIIRFRTKCENQKEPGRPIKQYNTLNLMCADNIKVPETVDEALSGEYSHYWLSAMQEEYKGLLENDTKELSNLPHGQKIVGCKWLFAVNRNKEGHVESFKA